MTQYVSPGVYVEEIPSAIKPIAGVSTSTAGFIGVVADKIDQPLAQLSVGTGDGTKTVFNLPVYPIDPAHSTVRVDGSAVTGVTLANDDTHKVSTATFTTAPAAPTATSPSKITLVPKFFLPVPAGTPTLCTTLRSSLAISVAIHNTVTLSTPCMAFSITAAAAATLCA